MVLNFSRKRPPGCIYENGRMRLYWLPILINFVSSRKRKHTFIVKNIMKGELTTSNSICWILLKRHMTISDHNGRMMKRTPRFLSVPSSDTWKHTCKSSRCSLREVFYSSFLYYVLDNISLCYGLLLLITPFFFFFLSISICVLCCLCSLFVYMWVQFRCLDGSCPGQHGAFYTWLSMRVSSRWTINSNADDEIESTVSSLMGSLRLEATGALNVMNRC